MVSDMETEETNGAIENGGGAGEVAGAGKKRKNNKRKVFICLSWFSLDLIVKFFPVQGLSKTHFPLLKLHSSDAFIP